MATQEPQYATLLDSLVDGAPGERHPFIDRLLATLRSCPSLDERGPYREALLHSPHRATELGELVAEQWRIITAFQSVDPDDREANAALADSLRENRRKEAALLAEIWYEEVGGEG